MKKILFILFLFSYFTYGQTYYGYKSRSSTNQTEASDSKLYCSDAIKLIESKARYLDISFGGYNEDAIEKIRWYEYNNFLYCIVFFKTNIYKGYIYGGWKYNFDNFYKLKTEFNKSSSKGEFFWEYIEKSKIDCE